MERRGPKGKPHSSGEKPPGEKKRGGGDKKNTGVGKRGPGFPGGGHHKKGGFKNRGEKKGALPHPGGKGGSAKRGGGWPKNREDKKKGASGEKRAPNKGCLSTRAGGKDPHKRATKRWCGPTP